MNKVPTAINKPLPKKRSTRAQKIKDLVDKLNQLYVEEAKYNLALKETRGDIRRTEQKLAALLDQVR